MKRQSMWRRELIRAVALKIKAYWDVMYFDKQLKTFRKERCLLSGSSIHEVFVFNCCKLRSLWWKKACVNKALGLLVPLNQRLQLNKCNVCTKYTDSVRHTPVNLRMCSLITLFHFYIRHFQLEIDHKRQILRNVLQSHKNVNKKLRVNVMKFHSQSGRNGEEKSPVRLNIRPYQTGKGTYIYIYIYIYIFENKTRNI